MTSPQMVAFKETYPNGWSLLHRETIDDALDKLGLTLNVTTRITE